MSADTEMGGTQPNGSVESHDTHVPATPPDATAALQSVPLLTHIASSQASIPDTEVPGSPMDPSASFRSDKTEPNDDRLPQPAVIPSSITSSQSPPPSSQLAQTHRSAGVAYSYANSQRPRSIVSPPATTAHVANRQSAAEPVPPSPNQIDSASVTELRAMLKSCLAMNATLKSEAAHHKLQYNLLSIQAGEDANRAMVEHEMTRREVEALRDADRARQARRELDARLDPTKIKYRELQTTFDALTKEHNSLRRRMKNASKVIAQQAEQNEALSNERDVLLNRIRENREHFHMLCSPGGAFHGALTPKTPPMTSPQQVRTTPRQTPRSASKTVHHENDPNSAGFAALLQALNQDSNTSAPSTPMSVKPPPRVPFKHNRSVHSMSSLPTTPFTRPRGNYSGLLPSADLVPQTEPAQRFGTSRFEPPTPTRLGGRRSRESTISAEDEAEAQPRAMTLESVAAAAQSYLSHSSHASQRQETEEEVYESQASQAASEMLRRDPRQSFDVASSVNSREGSPKPAEKPTKLQTKLYGPVQKAGMAPDKRKISRSAEFDASPPKKARYQNASIDGAIGLGIQNSRRRG
ncbi:hypothetical protein GGR57DRAFT_480196 [Xylariaceae sp. FL1272]|nr:hypothetical protein GGR57DRAFT_480196 [Xylariaceae sp. FL1272]